MVKCENCGDDVSLYYEKDGKKLCMLCYDDPNRKATTNINDTSAKKMSLLKMWKIEDDELKKNEWYKSQMKQLNRRLIAIALFFLILFPLTFLILYLGYIHYSVLSRAIFPVYAVCYGVFYFWFTSPKRWKKKEV
jgi:hypothetical protein